MNNDKIVLIVERDTGIANMIRAILGIIKVPVAHAQTGSHAMELLAQSNVGLIFCDSQVPDMNGYELLKKVRANPGTAQVPFIMIIAEDDDSRYHMKPEEMADRYITKPFTARKVLDVVKEFIVYRGI